MHQIINVAQREYTATVKTKTFIFGVLMAPLIIGCIILFTNRTMRGSSGPRRSSPSAWTTSGDSA